MMADVLLFGFCMVDELVLVAMTVYFIICLSDLECDYLNSRLGCRKLNKLVLPELVAACVTPILLLLTMHWFLFLLICPVAGYLVHRYVTTPRGSMGLYDPTEIRNRGLLLRFQKEAFIKLALHLVAFFVLLYCFIINLLL